MTTKGKRTGRPIGSGLGNYTINIDQERKCGTGRPKIIKTPEQIEEQREKKRKTVLACYYKRREKELQKRDIEMERQHRINLILESLRVQLLKNDDLINKSIESNFITINNIPILSN